MRVLFVTHENPTAVQGGLGTFVNSFVGALRKKAEVLVLYLRFNGEDQVPCGGLVDRVLDVRYSFPACTQEGKVLATALDLSWAVTPLIEEFQPDVIHCNDRQTYLPFRNFPRVVFSLHLSVPDLLGPALWDQEILTEAKIERLALQCSRATVVYSRFMASRVRATLGPGGNLFCLPLGADLVEGVRDPQKTGPRVFSFFGRLEDRQKGIEEYLQGIRLLGEDFIRTRNLEFRVYGRGRVGDWSGLPVTYCGFVEGEEKKRAYLETDVVVFPSRYEPFGLVGLEALSANALLMAPRGLGMDEYFSPGRNGVEIPSEARGIAEKIREVADNWEFYRRFRMGGRESVRGFTWERCVDSHLEVYQWARG